MFRRLVNPLTLGLLAVLVAWPLFRYGPPLQAEAITDGPNHLYRFVLLNWHIQQGDLFPRWFSDLHFGFGAPVLNFYAPLSYYLLVLIHLFVPSFPIAFQWGFILALAVAVLGMFLWVREEFSSSLAGLVAAAAYSFTPYTYFSVLDRAAYPELWGLALAPWLFWTGLRYLHQPSRLSRIALTLLCASLILVHNLSALLFLPILGLYLGLSWWAQAERQKEQLLWLGVSAAQAFGLALFFLLPFALEAQYVQLGRASGYLYSANFGSAAALFSLPVPFDAHNILQPRPISVPWPQMGLGLLSLGLAIRRKVRAEMWLTVVIAALAGSLIFLNLPLSLPLWNILPSVAQLIQFPFRLLGPAMLLLAWLGGAVAARLSRWPLVSWLAMGAFFFYSLTWTYHTPFDHFPDTLQSADIIRDEMAHPERVGTTNLQEFLPRWVESLPPADTLYPRYATAAVPSRLAALPTGVTLLAEQTGLTDSTLTYTAPQAFTVTYDIFYFPGWAATLDGQPIDIHIAAPHGLITIDAPAGQHTLALTLRPTAPKIVGVVLSLLTIFSFLFTWRSEPRSAPLTHTISSLSIGSLIVIAGLLVLRGLALDQVESPFNRDGLNHIPNPVSVNFDNQLKLIGYAFPKGQTLASNQTLTVQLYWQAATTLTTNYRTVLQLVDAQGNRFGQTDHQDPGTVPTSRWRPDQYAVDEHQLQSLSGTPPGTYEVRVSVYAPTPNGAQPLNVLTDAGQTVADYDLGSITVTAGEPRPANAVQLVEASLATDQIGVGDRLPFTALWNSGPAPQPGLIEIASLIDAGGQTLISAELPPTGPDFPSAAWQPNQLIRYPQYLDLPPDLPAGPAQVQLQLVDAQRTLVAGPFDLGLITITVPERTFTLPAIQNQTDYDFEGAIRLLGYDVTAEQITLYWQSLKPVSQRLTVFIHALAADGGLVNGQDRLPARSTTSWLPGEVITDVHPFAVGDRFEIGLYDAVTGERFGLAFVRQP